MTAESARSAVTTAIGNLVESMIDYDRWRNAPSHARIAGSAEEHEEQVDWRKQELDEALKDYERAIRESNDQ